MRWNPRRNGGNNLRTRWNQSHGSRDRADQGGTAGHHSYAKGHGGGNKVGATTRPNKEWSSKARKEEEHLTGIAKRATMDLIREGLDEMGNDLTPPDPETYGYGEPQPEDGWYDELVYHEDGTCTYEDDEPDFDGDDWTMPVYTADYEAWERWESQQ